MHTTEPLQRIVNTPLSVTRKCFSSLSIKMGRCSISDDVQLDVLACRRTG